MEPLEEVIDDLCDEIKRRHVERLRTGECEYARGYVYNDILTNFERIADHCSNLAIAVVERKEHVYDAHGYVNRLKADDRGFQEAYASYAERYALN